MLRHIVLKILRHVSLKMTDLEYRFFVFADIVEGAPQLCRTLPEVLDEVRFMSAEPRKSRLKRS